MTQQNKPVSANGSRRARFPDERAVNTTDVKAAGRSSLLTLLEMQKKEAIRTHLTALAQL